MPLRLLLAAVLALLVLPSTAGAAPAPLLSGPLAAGGTWAITAHHKSIGGFKGLCLEMRPTLADGFSPGSGTGCAAGSIRAVGNVVPVSMRSTSGDTTTAHVVGGIVIAKARKVVVSFADGKRLKVATKAGPKRWSRVLGAKVRYFGADALPTSTADVTRVTGYDARGHRVARGQG
jgi:hypothetical protein